MREGRSFWFVPAAVAMILVGCAQHETPTMVSAEPKTEIIPANEQETRPTLPNFAMKSLDGQRWELAQHRGKVVLVNFWATWCPPCRAEMPSLIALSKQYKSAGLDTVGISIDADGATKVKPFVKKVGIPYPILLPNMDDPLLQTVPNIPVTLLIDRQGRIAQKLVGGRPRQEFESYIRMLLAEKA